MGAHRKATEEERRDQALAIDQMAIKAGIGWAHRARELAKLIGVSEDRIRKVYRGAVRVSGETFEDWRLVMALRLDQQVNAAPIEDLALHDLGRTHCDPSVRWWSCK